VPSDAQTTHHRHADARPDHWIDRWLPWLFFGAVVISLFAYLGSAALFEPDEGRNSEKAREILVLKDWLTPRENFYPVLDKPIFFYWLIALSYKVLGVSEWAARLPSAMAALGCIGLVYYFVRQRWGRWEALWSGLILLGSYISCAGRDMSLTLFTCCGLFYEARHGELQPAQDAGFVLYGALVSPR
jgi:4-amino-4-deoxy-L-arabinose transferase-like glycosyltransferase